ncbi:response regulator transcription factor [Actinopolymorpha alba]|uniref:response regulator transcription factor n=1 Tax=Actinopolymorpha alba TaxID=533267 RepID=UPI0003823D6F|nr:response regulator transcription factor [Actinopolymorpha alba]
MAHILIAEDDPGISALIEKGLRLNGLTSTAVSDGAAALEQAAKGEFDLLLLDVGLPGLDGFTVLRRLRESGHPIPVIMVTARHSVADTVAGLDGGADDYLSKPFRVEELLARVRRRLRAGHAAAEVAFVRHDDLCLDLRARQITVNGRVADLTAREFRLVEIFLRYPGEVLSREWLLAQVWGYDFDPGSNVVDVYVRYLRRKIGSRRIETVRGHGYRLVSGFSCD